MMRTEDVVLRVALILLFLLGGVYLFAWQKIYKGYKLSPSPTGHEISIWIMRVAGVAGFVLGLYLSLTALREFTPQ